MHPRTGYNALHHAVPSWAVLLMEHLGYAVPLMNAGSHFVFPVMLIMQCLYSDRLTGVRNSEHFSQASADRYRLIIVFEMVLLAAGLCSVF